MDYFKDHLTQNKGNPKNFWKTLKLVLPGKWKSSRIEKLVVKNSTLTEPKLIADGPNQYFTGIAKAVLTDSGRENNASVGGNVNIHIHQEKQFQASFVFKSVSNEQAYKALCSLKNGKATGADGIPVKALKLASRYIAPSIAYLCNESFRLGVYPSSWKVARITPLFKGGNSSDCDNLFLKLCTTTNVPNIWFLICQNARAFEQEH